MADVVRLVDEYEASRTENASRSADKSGMFWDQPGWADTSVIEFRVRGDRPLCHLSGSRAGGAN
jgi:hypothetical protein